MHQEIALCSIPRELQQPGGELSLTPDHLLGLLPRLLAAYEVVFLTWAGFLAITPFLTGPRGEQPRVGPQQGEAPGDLMNSAKWVVWAGPAKGHFRLVWFMCAFVYFCLNSTD